MQISIQKTSNTKNFSRHHDRGFSILEIMVALLLVSLIFFAIPSGDSTARHRALAAAVDDINRAVAFASNESVLRNSVVRLRLRLDKNPIEYTVEFGPPGNLPLPDMPERTNMTLDEAKEQQDKAAAFDRQFNPVPEFEEIKRELDPEVTILGVASTIQKDIITKESANIYFYPTGEKDGALVFFSTVEEMAWLEVAPFLPDTRSTFESVKQGGVAKVEDVISTRMDEVVKEWLGK